MGVDVPFRVVPAHRDALGVQGLLNLEACLAYEGGDPVKNALPGRETLRVGAGPHAYFMKRVRGPGWREILAEARVLERLHAEGHPVPEPVGCGAAGGSGVLLTRALPADRSLERVLLEDEPDEERTRGLARRVAAVVRRLHDAGVNHRDLYAGHFLLGEEDTVYLVDLGRAETRARVPRRRVIKDLAALRFSVGGSSRGRVFTEELLRAYADGGAGGEAGERLSRSVARKARRMRRHAVREVARGAPNVHVND